MSAGDYYLFFGTPNGGAISPKDQGGDDNLDSDVNANGYTDDFVLLPNQNRTDLDIGFILPLLQSQSRTIGGPRLPPP